MTDKAKGQRTTIVASLLIQKKYQLRKELAGQSETTSKKSLGYDMHQCCAQHPRCLQEPGSVPGDANCADSQKGPTPKTNHGGHSGHGV